MINIDEIKNYLNIIYKYWYLATNKDANDDKIRLGVESDWKCNEAKKLLAKDETGLLSILCMRSAYKKHINEMSISVKHALSEEWQKRINYYNKLKYCLFNNLGKEIYDGFIDSINIVFKSLGSFEAFNSDDIDIEDVIVKAIDKFTDNYTFHHDLIQGNISDMEKVNNISIYRHLFVFDSYYKFAQEMKNTSGNFICVSMIDQGEFNKYFIFGIKNNNTIICFNDRQINHSPLHDKLTRNPGRNFYDKCNYDYLPYNKINTILDNYKLIENKQEYKLLSYNNERTTSDNSNDIINVCDKDTVAYISIIIGLLYRKYFIDLNDNYVTNKLYFKEDILLLENKQFTTNTVSVRIGDKIYLPTITNYETFTYNSHNAYFAGENIYNHGYWDYLLNLYPMPEDADYSISLPDDFVGDESDIDKRIWWEMRYKQYLHLMDCLHNNQYKREDELRNWLTTKVVANAENIFKYILNTNDYDDLKKNYKWNRVYNQDEDLPVVYEVLLDNKPLKSTAIKTFKEDVNWTPPYRSLTSYLKIFETKDDLIGKVYLFNLYGGQFAFTCGNDSVDKKTISIRLLLRSYTDLYDMLSIKEEDLPKEYIKLFNAMTNDSQHYGSRYDFMPYSGNNILDFTDPMNNIKQPYHENFRCSISLMVSKSFYKKLMKKFRGD